MVALGNFDGVHRGHQVVVREAVGVARERGWRAMAATFDPHPRAVLRPGSEPPLLTTLELRREALLALGVEEVRVVRFDEGLSRKSPEEFVRDVLVGQMEAGMVVVGENFRFGKGASGDAAALGRLMEDLGGEARAVSMERGNGGEISSSRIRELLGTGDVREAARLLGRPYVLRGEVVRGDERGRTIGFPTANVLPDLAVVVPARGVYAGRVRVGGEWRGAAVNIGLAPTFDRGESRVEAHLLDYDDDLYGRVVNVAFVERVRAEKKFSGVEELKEQIKRDVASVRRVLEEY